MRNRIWCILICLLIWPQVSFAQSIDEVEELERRIDILAQEIEQIKLGEATATADRAQFGLGHAVSDEADRPVFRRQSPVATDASAPSCPGRPGYGLLRRFNMEKTYRQSLACWLVHRAA